MKYSIRMLVLIMLLLLFIKIKETKYLKILEDCHSDAIKFSDIIRNYYNVKETLKLKYILMSGF
jgi:hypothetical protein